PPAHPRTSGAESHSVKSRPLPLSPMNETELAASPLLAPLFATTEMRALHADRAVIGRMLRFEAALARAEAAAGVIPHSAAAAIKSACNPARFDPAALGKGAALAGNPAIPLVKALT